MTKDEIIHVTGSTQDEVNESFLAAKTHYTPAGATRPSKGIMNRLYREAGEARARLEQSAAEVRPAGYRMETVRPDAVRSPDGKVTEVDAFLADTDAKPPRSAAGAKAAQEHGKVTDIRRRVNRNKAAESQAADRVDEAIATAKAAAEDPYRQAMKNRRDADRKRGPGRKISEEELVELIRKLTTEHPDYKVGQVWEVCMWTEKLAISKGRFDTAWRTATGTEPARRPTARRAG